MFAQGWAQEGRIPRDVASWPDISIPRKRLQTRGGNNRASCCPLGPLGLHPVWRGFGGTDPAVPDRVGTAELDMCNIALFSDVASNKAPGQLSQRFWNQAVNPRSVCLAPSHSHSGILSIPVGWRQPDLPSQLLCPVPLPPEGIRACVRWLQSRQSPARARKEKFPFQRQPGKAFLEDESMWSLWSPWMCSGVHTQTVRLPKVGSILHLIKGESSHLSKVLI